ncbi:hypothetical protein BDF22DRAFT_743082 [Syncephalis plumigaleata]|nr:hypothetical protein BDF22DRAFT_743082 [Syncephalis plumigaleata]
MSFVSNNDNGHRYNNNGDPNITHISVPERAHVGPGANARFDLTGYETDALSRQGPMSNYAVTEYNAGDPNYMEEKPRTGMQRFFKTRRRMCLCICCLLTLIIIAVLIPVVIFVIVPAIAQSNVNGSKMVITSTNITSPQEDSFVMKMAGMVTDTGPLDAQIEMKDKVTMYYNGEELGRMAMDPINAKAGVGATLDSAPTFEVTNKDAFGRFSKVMMGEKSFTWVMKGMARVRAMGLLTIDNIKLEKELTFAGMQNFLNVKIKSFDLPSNHPLGGITMNVESSMENPSIFGMELGQLTFDIFYKDVRIVTANATEVNLVPGVNDLAMKGRMIPQARSEDLAVVGTMFSDYMNGRSSDMKVVGVAVRPTADSKPITWLQAGFNGLTLNVKLDSKEDGRLIQSLDLGPLEMKFSPANAWAPVTSAPNVVAGFKMPFGFPLEMKQVEQDITAYDNGVAMATMKVPMSKASGTSASGQIVTAISNIPMEVISSQHARFSQFVHDLTLGTGKSMTMRGTVSSIAGTAIGDVRIDGIKLDQSVSMQGLQGLATTPLVASDVHVRGGNAEAMEIALTCTMTNPSNIAMDIGDVTFQVFSQGQDVGRAVIRNMQLKPGSNSVPSVFYFSPKTASAKAAGRVMLENFMSGVDHQIGISGFEGSTPVASLVQGLSKLRFTTSVPAIHDLMLRGSQYSLNLLTVPFTRKSKVRVQIYNPLDAPVTITKMKGTMVSKGATIGTIDQTFPNGQLVLPPKSSVWTPVFDMRVALSLDAIKIVLTSPNGAMVVDVDSSMEAFVGGYPISLSYRQAGLNVEKVNTL